VYLEDCCYSSLFSKDFVKYKTSSRAASVNSVEFATKPAETTKKPDTPASRLPRRSEGRHATMAATTRAQLPMRGAAASASLSSTTSEPSVSPPAQATSMKSSVEAAKLTVVTSGRAIPPSKLPQRSSKAPATLKATTRDRPVRRFCPLPNASYLFLPCLVSPCRSQADSRGRKSAN